ncbi:MAG: hypothetical protein AAGC86_04915 [Pseudomonadota bacterium]
MTDPIEHSLRVRIDGQNIRAMRDELRANVTDIRLGPGLQQLALRRLGRFQISRVVQSRDADGGHPRAGAAFNRDRSFDGLDGVTLSEDVPLR